MGDLGIVDTIPTYWRIVPYRTCRSKSRIRFLQLLTLKTYLPENPAVRANPLLGDLRLFIVLLHPSSRRASISGLCIHFWTLISSLHLRPLLARSIRFWSLIPSWQSHPLLASSIPVLIQGCGRLARSNFAFHACLTDFHEAIPSCCEMHNLA